MTNLNINTKPANDLTDDEYLSRDIEIIYDSVRNLYNLSKHENVPLNLLNTMLRLLLEKMANAFNQIESHLSMYAFVEELRAAKTEEENAAIVKKYMAASDSSPRRVYE